MNTRSDNTPAQRRNPSSGVRSQPGQSNIIFLTITTESREPWLDNEITHHLLRETWPEATAWLVGDYLLMPDHLHLFCAPRNLEATLEGWIKYWKRQFNLKHNRQGWKFQSRGWHHRLRDSESYSQKWIYVQENPYR